MRRIKAAMGVAAVVTTAVAGLGATAAPAQASSATCTDRGLTYLCAYGEVAVTLADGTTQVFAVAPDHTLRTSWDNSASVWTSWRSMGGYAQSPINDSYSFGDNDLYHFAIVVLGANGHGEYRERGDDGVWTPWQPACFLNDNFGGCA